MAWKYSLPALPRSRVEQFGQWMVLDTPIQLIAEKMACQVPGERFFWGHDSRRFS
jgi:hypothetical protein